MEDLQHIDAEEADPDFDDVFQISDDEDEEVPKLCSLISEFVGK